jgi:serine/threonine protein kinase
MIVCPTCSHQNPDGAASCSACGTSLVGLTTASGGKSYPFALAPGTKLQGGAYSIGRVLGQGGFGITYKGNDVNLGRLVAIKECFPDGSGRKEKTVVPPSNVSPQEWDLVKREFIEEARTVARFSHPGIVNVYAVFEENGTAYQAMEFLDGQSAGSLVEKGKLPENEAVSIIERVADALATMHASGFIHRDLKPDNIVQTKDGRTVLIDFGTAKQFVREKTQKLTPMLTPGYAPLEQYSSQARFDHRLDIYALGATLYHLLTGEVPVAAVERAAGVELPSVRDKNPSVSQAVSDAVERAMAVKVGERFDSVRDFAQALRATKETPASPRPSQPQQPKPQESQPKPQASPPRSNAPQAPRAQPAAPRSPFQVVGEVLWEGLQKGLDAVQPALKPLPRPQDNPYLGDIGALNSELQRPATPPPFAQQARLDDLDRQLRTLANPVPPAMSCPSCHENAMRTVSGNYSGACPFDGATLVRIEWPVGKCPVCREGTLQSHALPPTEFICAVCRRAPVGRIERPRLMGFVSVSEFECPSCHAAYSPVSNTAARLREVVPPFHSPMLGQTRTFAQWNEGAGATGNALDCSACQARFLEQASGAWTLVSWSSDPFGVGQNAGGQSATPEHWAKIASGGSQDPSTHRCPTCRSGWQVDLGKETLALIRANPAEVERARQWGFAPATPFPIQRWIAKSSGKTSGEPGRVCGRCRSEFDARPGDRWALVVSSNPLLNARSALVLDWMDWHRVGARLPLQEEEAMLRREQQTMSNARDIERGKYQGTGDTRRREINSRLDALFKRAVVEGFVDLGLSSSNAKPGERILWACAATSFKHRVRGGQTFWDSDELGRFVLTGSRFWIENRSAFKARFLGEVRSVEVQLQARVPILVLVLSTLPKPLGFSLDRPEIEVSVEGVTRRITFDTQDVAAMIRARL